MKLHSSAEDFKSLISATAQWMKIRELYVEKDYWVTFILKRLSELPEVNRIIFKGGTSLSKGYNLIKRFSEDVDLAILRDGLNNSQTERLIKETSKALTKDPFFEVEDPNITSKKGMSRVTLHGYPRSIDGNDYGPVRETILLEINCFGHPTPNLKKPIQSFISDFLEQNGQKDAILDFGLEQFEVSVLDYKRTFVEKILALTYASLEDGADGDLETRGKIRHFYDLTILFGQEDVKTFFVSQKFIDMMALIREEEKLASRIKWTEHKLSSSSLHRQSKKVLDRVEKYYQLDLEPMVFLPEDLPDFRVVRRAFDEISSMIAKNDL